MESEPVIVVDQENCFNEEDEDIDDVAGNGQGCPDTPPQDPFFLSPFRDMRKHSLPTPQCTSGITASQVRRLSDQGAASAAAREKAFLATLTKAPGPYTPGRRHSVITISKAPMPLFGRNRRESIAAFPSKGPRVNRRDSAGGATPSPTGSQFNLQLDIMDDIADIKAARKVRMKMWQTEDKEKMCELQSMDGENKQMSRFKEARRYSNIDVCEKIAPPIPARRRASELPPNSTPQAPGKPSTGASQSSGIVCTNTDLLSIMNSLKSSASKALQSTTKGGGGDPRQRVNSKTTDSLPPPPPSAADKKPGDVVVWDRPTGSVVDAEVLGTAIEGFLAAKKSGDSADASPTAADGELHHEHLQQQQQQQQTSGKPSAADPNAAAGRTCDTSICSSLKDLFVK